ncbi:GntR family transcriptional regulator [Aeromicrobium sp. CTD01-1L150]|uniref:GntR family transcriptional regulator n=1 Tax=Aeromicrobium sp. CTD01-1L150 TaxID=3341830 RepID=UPI0035BFA78C
MADVDGTGRDVAARIRQAILDGDVAPNQRLIEADLCEMFSASRASVRGALVELANEGIVERIRNRGARVRAISFAEALEISEVRLKLEGLCARRAAERVSDAEVQELRGIGTQMEEAVASGDLMAYSALNKRLHARIGEIGGQSTANQIIARLRAQMVRHQYRLAMEPGRANVSLGEHLSMIEAVCERDPKKAESAAQRHLESVMRSLEDAAQRLGAVPDEF